MAALMARYHRGYVVDLVTGIDCSSTEIHVLEPKRMKLFIEASQLFPNILTDHEESAGGLFDGAGLQEVAVQITVSAVGWVRCPQAVESEQFVD